jgi:hypothetical protein
MLADEHLKRAAREVFETNPRKVAATKLRDGLRCCRAQ